MAKTCPLPSPSFPCSRISAEGACRARMVVFFGNADICCWIVEKADLL